MLFVYPGGGRSGGIRMTGDRKFRFFAGSPLQNGASGIMAAGWYAVQVF